MRAEHLDRGAARIAARIVDSDGFKETLRRVRAAPNRSAESGDQKRTLVYQRQGPLRPSPR